MSNRICRCGSCGRFLPEHKMERLSVNKVDGRCKRCASNYYKIKYKLDRVFRNNRLTYHRNYNRKINKTESDSLLRTVILRLDINELNIASRLAKEVYNTRKISKHGLIRTLITKFIIEARKEQQLEII
jgi:excinuclease UvrABC ATPase subunit